MEVQIAASFSKLEVAGVITPWLTLTLTVVDLFFDFDSDIDLFFDFGLDQVVGGIDMMQQACKLATRPHIVVSVAEESGVYGEPGMVGLSCIPFQAQCR